MKQRSNEIHNQTVLAVPRQTVLAVLLSQLCRLGKINLVTYNPRFLPRERFLSGCRRQRWCSTNLSQVVLGEHKLDTRQPNNGRQAGNLPYGG